MSFRLVHRNVSGSNALSVLRRPRSLHTPIRLNRLPRAQFHYSSANNASATATVKVLPSLGQATAQEIVKKLESGDARLQFTVAEKQQIETFAINSFTSQRTNIVSEVKQLSSTISSIEDDFATIQNSLEKLDNTGGLAHKGKPVVFHDKWAKLHGEYTSLISASKRDATSTRNQIAKLIYHVIPSLNDAKTEDERRGCIDTYIANLRVFESAGLEQENRFRRLRVDVENFRKSVLSSVDEKQKESGTILEGLDQKIAKLQKELEKSKGIFSWSSGGDQAKSSSELDNLKNERSNVVVKIKGIESLKPNELNATFNHLLGRLAAMHGIWRMLDNDAQTLREDLGATESARQTGSKTYLKSNEYALLVTYELFYSALDAYCLGVEGVQVGKSQ